MNNSLVTLIIGTFVIFFILFVLYMFSKKMGTIPIKGRESKYTKVIDRIILSRDKYIELIEVGEDVLIVGISSSSLELLHKIKKDQLVANNEQAKYESFKDMFNKFFVKKQKAMEENDEKNNL